MKIKVKPEDFIVEELIDAPIIRKKGEFGLYRLTKRRQNTLEVLRIISKNTRLAFDDFSYGGRKDRHALSTQYITVKNNPSPLKIKEDDFALEFLGFISRPMGPDLICGNRFNITIRSLSSQDIEDASTGLPVVNKLGFLNYFDDQRFGTYDQTQGFLAQKLLKKHFNGALKIYLTRVTSEDKKKDRERKAALFKKWGDWPSCFKEARLSFEKFAFDRLTHDAGSFISLLREIPAQELSLFISCYQAFLWNEVLRRWIKLQTSSCASTSAGAPMNVYRGLAGDYIFPTERLQNIPIPTPASKMPAMDPNVENIYQAVFKENGLIRPMFNITKIRQAYFKSTPRSAIVLPVKLIFEFSEDEMRAGQKKLVLKFVLPRGSYATMLIKRIFSAPGSP
ncbi:MAG: tRNA pseudouridine(13) synthase TruD [Candidatus Omnitrophota bacterium]